MQMGLCDVIPRPFRRDGMSWRGERHQSLYAKDGGGEHSFGPLEASRLVEFVAGQDPKRGWITEAAGL
ncbi:hypothetical protein [Pseudodonghicola sp.]|uniref:hypothetical protein n=1 Tax=Pseudodonghicola sp. TaxID=1969463 RepID=UPI003A96B00A